MICNKKSILSILPYITALMTNFIFGLSFLFSKKALGVTDPITLLSFRFLTAFLVMTLLIALRVIKVNYKHKPIEWLIGISFFEPVIYFIFETYGLQRTASSLAGLMIALIPVVVTILAAYLLKEKPTPKQTANIILSVAGVILIVVMGSSDSKESSILGIILLLGAVFSASFFNIISRKISIKFTAFEITYFMMFIGAICFNGISIIKLAVNKKLSFYFAPLKSVTFITSILYLGIISSIIAYFLVNYTLSKMEASRCSVFANISTIVSVTAGVVILNESFYWYHVIGAIMILVGVGGTNYYRAKSEESEATNI
ncbi:DMT family transporter [Clostridium sp. P21]|uniref:DMT family transporter n=1 Tax=Clostridium muellerianum TaxID=2716538 RepID=A0A7Y0EGV1_9CLOT|nr:DMT family transporter [Clostridium muellerianum]NMM63156.1 DMT family transporter [Clostridium muellerianum]